LTKLAAAKFLSLDLEIAELFLTARTPQESTRSMTMALQSSVAVLTVLPTPAASSWQNLLTASYWQDFSRRLPTRSRRGNPTRRRREPSLSALDKATAPPLLPSTLDCLEVVELPLIVPRVSANKPQTAHHGDNRCWC
jgi:hypothetical protein